MQIIVEPCRWGRALAIQELSCGHRIHTGLMMNTFRVAKGQLTPCPQGCGDMVTSHVRSVKRSV